MNELKIYSAADLARLQFKSSRPLVNDLMGRREVGFLFGLFGLGKTLLGLDLGIHLALGKPWLNRFALQKAPALHVSSDDPLSRFQFRQKEMLNGYGYSVPKHLYFAHVQLDLTDPAQFADLTEQVKTHKIQFLTLDVLNQMLPGIDENSMAEVGPVMRNLKALAWEAGTTILLIDHTTKYGSKQFSGLRGSGAKHGGADFLWLLSTTRTDGVLSLSCRHKEFGATGPLYLQRSPRGSSQPKFTLTVPPSTKGKTTSQAKKSTRQRVFNAVGSKWISRGEVVKITGLPASTVKRHLGHLVFDGKIRVRGSNRSTRYKSK